MEVRFLSTAPYFFRDDLAHAVAKSASQRAFRKAGTGFSDNLRDKATKSRIPDEPERMRFQNAFNEIGVGERALESWFYRILVASRPPFAPEAKPVSTLAENALAKAEIGAAERLPAINRPDAAGKGRT